MRSKINYWTFEKCFEEALKYTTKIDFIKNSNNVYKIAWRNDWLKDITSHMVELQKPIGYWNNKENCINEALKYETRSEFRKHSSGTYSAVLLNNWLEDVCKHMIYKQKPHNYWTFERCKELVNNYKTISEVKIKNNGAYKAILRNGWDEELFLNMSIVGSKYKRLIYAFEFTDKSVYIGLTYDSEERYRGHFINEHKNKSTPFKYFEKTNLNPEFKLLTDYVDVELAIKLEGEYLEKYRQDGWNILNKKKTGGIGNYKKI